ncbi:LCP family protein [Micromonospora sp. NPDC049559]|uniref:LCP family protein n=1 Tax=Micromonospora sp. NPDC049559 TaxID=3155923 RepID=UPI00344A8BE4
MQTRGRSGADQDGAPSDGRRGDGKEPVRPRRRRGPLWAKLTVAFGALLLLLSGGTLVAAKVAISEATSNITQADLLGGDDGGAAPTEPAGKNIEGPLNLLLVGIDVRPNWDAGARADTIIIVHIPASHDQAYLISIPRDWRVRIPAYPKGNYPGGTTKINAAFEFGYRIQGTELEKRASGFKLLADTLKKETGLTFNGAALIDFQGFSAVIKELGGVDMYVDQNAKSIHLAYDKNGKIVPVSFDEDSHRVFNIPKGGHVIEYKVGQQHMSAELALDYARIRYGLPKTDYDRQRHQQQLIKAIAKKATSAGVVTDLGKLNRVIAAAGKAFILDTKKVPIADFLFTLKGVATNDMVVLKTNQGNFNEVKIDGVSYQKLNDKSLEMIEAAKDGTLADWVRAHPEMKQETNG